MNVKDVIKMFEQSTGDSLLELTIPSSKKIVSFKSMTVGHRKSLVKFASTGQKEEEQLINFQIAKLSLIKTLCINDIDEKALTEIDFIYILANIRMVNLLDNLIIENNKCPNCNNIFSHIIDFSTICNKCENFNFKTSEVIIIDKKKNEWKFILNYPSIYNSIILEKYMIETDNNSDILKTMSFPFLYISDIFINGEKVEDYSNYDILERIKFFDKIPEYVPFYSKGGLIEKIYELYDFNEIFEIYGKVECSKCKFNMEGVLASDSFFTL